MAISSFPKVLTNPVGYHPAAGKFVVVVGLLKANTFSVTDIYQLCCV